jgi:hypothetical protein
VQRYNVCNTRVLDFMGVLQNIPIDPVVRRGLDEHARHPIFDGMAAWCLSIVELVVSYFLSMMPGWSTESYIRLVYHWLLKNKIVAVVNARDEARVMHEEDMRLKAQQMADEIQHDIDEADKDRLFRGEEWADEEIIREINPREGILDNRVEFLAQEEMKGFGKVGHLDSEASDELKEKNE